MATDRNIPGLRIGEVARRTGTTTALLRAWERRHGVLTPARTAGGQRLYSEDDVERVRIVKRLVAEGWSIEGAVARLRDSGEYAAPTPLDPPDEEPPRRDAAIHDMRSRADLLDPLADADPEAVAAAYRTARAMLRADEPAQIREALIALVEHLGGTIGSAATQEPDVIPVDLSLGVGAPQLPRADPASIARMRLEAILPSLVEDGRALAHRLQLARQAAEQSV